MQCCLPFVPKVQERLQARGMVIVQPCFVDNAGILQAIKTTEIGKGKTSAAYRMSFNCVNNGAWEIAPPAKALAALTDGGLYQQHWTESDVFELIEKKWEHMKSKGKGLHKGCMPFMENCVYHKDLAPDNFRGNRSRGRKNSFYPAIDAVNNDVHAIGRARNDLKCHPLHLDEYADNKRSLLRLCPSEQKMPGIFTSFAYLKFGFKFFNLHVEQLHLPFVHHQLCGESMWIIIPHSERTKLQDVVREMARVQYEWQQSQSGAKANVALSEEELDILSEVLFYSKSLFPPLSLLQKYGVTYRRVVLKAGQVFVAHGGYAHFGFSTDPGETHSLACNIMTENWLVSGGPEFVLDYFEWVSQLAEMKNVEAGLEAMGITTAHLANALNTCPHGFTCAMFKALQKDLEGFRLRSNGCTEHVFSYSLNHFAVETALISIHFALAVLHKPSVRGFLDRYFEVKKKPQIEFSQMCDCPPASDNLEFPSGIATKLSDRLDKFSYLQAKTPLKDARMRSRNDGAATALPVLATKSVESCVLEPRVSLSYGCATGGSIEKMLAAFKHETLPEPLRLGTHSRFLDIGSGCGHVVIHAQLRCEMASAIGIECVPERQSVAQQMVDYLQKGRLKELSISPAVINEAKPFLVKAPLHGVHFVEGLIEHHKRLIQAATHVYMFDSAFSDDTRHFVLRCLAQGRARVFLTCRNFVALQKLWVDAHSGESPGQMPFRLVCVVKLVMCQAKSERSGFVYVTG